MLTDVKTAVILTIIPNIILNMIFIFRGPRWRETIGYFYFMAFFVTIGTIFGSKLLIYASKDFLKGALALMLLAAIITNNKSTIRLTKFDQNNKLIQAIFGFAAGLMGGAVNIAVPFLTVYFVNTDYAPAVMSQAFNLCFIFSKISQAIILGAAGQFGIVEITIGAVLTLVAVVAQKPGLRMQDGISTETYKKYLNISTIVMAVLVTFDLLISLARNT